MADENQEAQNKCPKCEASMPMGMVVCTSCGHDSRKGGAVESGSGGDEEESKPKTPPGKIAARVAMAMALLFFGGVVGVGLYFLLRGPVYELEGEKFDQRGWRQEIKDSTLWQIYFEHRRASKDWQRPVLKLKGRQSSEGEMELRGPTIKLELTITDAVTKEEVFSGFRTGRNIPAREISVSLLRDAALGAIGKRGQTTSALLRVFRTKLMMDAEGPRQDYVDALGAMGAAARKAAPDMCGMLASEEDADLRQACFRALTHMYGGDATNEVYVRVLCSALNHEDGEFRTLASNALRACGKPVLPALRAVVAKGSKDGKALAAKLITEIDPPPKPKKRVFTW